MSALDDLRHKDELDDIETVVLYWAECGIGEAAEEEAEKAAVKLDQLLANHAAAVESLRSVISMTQYFRLDEGQMERFTGACAVLSRLEAEVNNGPENSDNNGE